MEHFSYLLDQEKEKVLSLQDYFKQKAKNKEFKLNVDFKEFYEVKIMFAWILMKIPMKKKFIFPLVKKAYQSYYAVLYNYSMVKIEKLLAVNGFKHIFRYFIESGLMEEMILTDSTLSCNQEGYRKGVWTIVNILNRESL